ncbi:hypothetical protein ACFFX1_10940 [Dactylosporangium sucinum]|uniref:Uncharacterized protein n=1 Tax=Dactylosporangium sucinum TaxID=1424081 RepID=A0A917WR65_9ACTN|nr:hypothetical protein [Dactylosporangium sucinum]GGM22735.1 hypothetical protein GCM10007977_024900 [Dactylosporangium sucinum]
MTRPIEDPFWTSAPPGERVDADTMTALRVLHALCGQLAASVAAVGADRDRRDSLIGLLDALSRGAAGEVGAHGYTWDSLLIDHHWRLTHLYAAAALDYAWAASRIATKLAAGAGPVVPLQQWPDRERHPGPDWLTADPGHRVSPLQLPAPDDRLGQRHAGQVREANALLAETHPRMHDLVVRVLKVHPDDLRSGGDATDAPRLSQDDHAAYEPRRVRLHEAATALHIHAAACARAVVLLNVASAEGRRDG